LYANLRIAAYTYEIFARHLKALARHLVPQKMMRHRYKFHLGSFIANPLPLKVTAGGEKTFRIGALHLPQ